MYYTAHKRDDKKTQSVREHSLGTKTLAEEYAYGIGLKSTAQLCAYLHDIGKLCVDFDDYINKRNSMKRGEIDHCYAGGRYILEIARKLASGDTKIIYTAELIARVVVSHHGIHDWSDEDGNYYLDYRIGKNERYVEISTAVAKIFPEETVATLLKKSTNEIVEIIQRIKEIVKTAYQKTEVDNKIICENLGFYQGMLERLMESILVDADRTDTADFMGGKSTSLSYDKEKIWDNMSQAVEEKSEEFRKKTDPISKRRMSISDRCKAFATHDVGICRLIVPTGGGKTISSMRFAIEYARRNKMDRIFYVAPFMSILEQNSDVIRNFMKEDKELFLEHHSNMTAHFEDNSDELREYEIRTEKWDSPVIATTLVQFLNSLFSGEMSCVRRMHRLAKSVIIIDEVQSIPIKCVNLCNLALNFLSKICGCTIVLCSATQPQFENTKYPLLIDRDENMTLDYTEDFKAFKRTKLIDCTRKEGYTYDEAANFCYDKFEKTGSLLVVVNTKTAAKEIFRKLNEMNELFEKPAEIIHLSTAMCPAHRKKAIDRVKELTASNSPSVKPVICVTTQLIEAGVDISFKCVVRSLAGLDNAAQAAGRCNRNGEFDCCSVYLIDIKEENLGNLQEIKIAQNVSRNIIDSGKYDDLFSVEAAKDYFNGLFRERDDYLSYKAADVGKEINTNLVEMLSVCSTRNRTPSRPFRQAFASAERQFRVIDDDTVGVIVPYNKDAREIIDDLDTEKDPVKIQGLLRKAQMYCVNIYLNMIQKLREKRIVRETPQGYYVLENRYYDETLGLNVENTKPELLFY